MVTARPFSFPLYLALVCALSWPFQLAYAWLGEASRPLLLVSMLMAGLATFIAGRWLFADGFAGAGWGLGTPRTWMWALLLPLFLWLLPLLIEAHAGWRTPPPSIAYGALIADFAAAFVLTLLPALGEEFSWRGYLLPRLLQRFAPRKALLLHGLVTWFWHLPVLLVLALQIETSAIPAIALLLALSLLPTVMHALVFAWLWVRSASLLVVTLYHAGFDEVRDALQQHAGFGVFAEYWQAVALTVLGALVWHQAARCDGGYWNRSGKVDSAVRDGATE